MLMSFAKCHMRYIFHTDHMHAIVMIAQKASRM